LSDIETNKNTLLILKVTYGIISGYSIDNESVLNTLPDNISVDTSNINIIFFNDDDSNIEKFFSKKELSYVNIDDVYEVELDGKIYYHIQDIKDGDGDFIGMDSDKKIYKITHDPYEIKLLSESLIDVLMKMSNGNDYLYDRRLGVKCMENLLIITDDETRGKVGVYYQSRLPIIKGILIKYTHKTMKKMNEIIEKHYYKNPEDDYDVLAMSHVLESHWTMLGASGKLNCHYE